MSAKIGTRVVVRTNIDWGTLDAASFAEQQADGRPVHFIRAVARRNGLDLWRDTFALDFFEFRSALREIAESNLRAVAGAELSFGVGDMSWFDEGDEYVFPIDDDDLFHPELARRASAKAAGKPLVLWPANQLVADGGTPKVRPIPVASFATNNGGFRSSTLRQHFSREEARDILLRHEVATKALATRVLGIPTPDSAKESLMATDLRGPQTFYTDAWLGLTIKHPGSLITLFHALRTDDPASALRGSLARARWSLPWRLRWAKPWVREIEALLARLAGP